MITAQINNISVGNRLTFKNEEDRWFKKYQKENTRAHKRRMEIKDRQENGDRYMQQRMDRSEAVEAWAKVIIVLGALGFVGVKGCQCYNNVNSAAKHIAEQPAKVIIVNDPKKDTIEVNIDGKKMKIPRIPSASPDSTAKKH
jgi:hypothetical protein